MPWLALADRSENTSHKRGQECHILTCWGGCPHVSPVWEDEQLRDTTMVWEAERLSSALTAPFGPLHGPGSGENTPAV